MWLLARLVRSLCACRGTKVGEYCWGEWVVHGDQFTYSSLYIAHQGCLETEELVWEIVRLVGMPRKLANVGRRKISALLHG